MPKQIIETSTKIEDFVRNNIKNTIDLLATQYVIEIEKLNMLIQLFVELRIADKSQKSLLQSLFSEIQKTNKNVFLLSSVFFLIKHSNKTGQVEVLSGGKMSGGNVGHFFIILMWILYGTYFLSYNSLNQTSIFSQDGNNQQISIPKNAIEPLYQQYHEFMNNFATSYNKQIESKMHGSLQGILSIKLEKTNETLVINLPNTFDTVYGNITEDIEFETAKQNIIDKYIPTGADLVSVIEDAALMGVVNTAMNQISSIEITPAAITSAAENALYVANIASNVASFATKNPVTSATVAAVAFKSTLTELATKYNNIIGVVETAEKTIQKTYDAAIQFIASNPKENIERLNKLKTQIKKHEEFVQQLQKSSNNLRGTVINAVTDLINDKPLNTPVAEESKKITDNQINQLIKDINVDIFMFATNVSYEITKTSGSIIINFCKKILGDIYNNKFDSLIGASVFLIPLILYSGFFKIQSKKSSPLAIKNDSASTAVTTKKGGRKTKKSSNLKKHKTQKKSKYIRKLRKNSVII